MLTEANPFMDYMIGVAPITSKTKPFPLHVSLPKELKITGEVLLEHHRMIDIETRGFWFVETAPKHVVQECLDKIQLLYK